MNLTCQAKRFILWPQFPTVTSAVDPLSESEEFYSFVRGELVKRRITNAALAKAAQVSRQRLYRVMSNQEKGYRIRLVVAQQCQLPVQYFWPDTPSQFLEAA